MPAKKAASNKVKKTGAKKSARKQPDLPNIEGPGVGQVKIDAVEQAAAQYIKERDKRCAMTPKEIAAKQKLLDALHANKEKLGTDGEGATVYRYDDLVITLKPGKETLSVKAAATPELDDE